MQERRWLPMSMKEKELLNNRYEIIKPVGSGGMAEVYLAKDTYLDRQVAIKMLRAQFQNDINLLEQFRREAKSAARLIHPYIINIYDVISTEEEQYIVMEYVDGITLKKYMEQYHLNLCEVLDISIRLAEGLRHAHNRNVVHCDIKPLNILLDKELNPKIADFGIAKVISNQTMVYTNAIMGSVHYISPEQASGGKVTSLSDIYSLGVVIFEMLTGQVPFNGATAVAVAMMHVEKPIPRLSEYMENVPKGLQEIIDKAMAKNPSERYQNAAALRRDLLNLRMELDPDNTKIELMPSKELEEDKREAFSNTDTVVMQAVHTADVNLDLADTRIIKEGQATTAKEKKMSKLEAEVKEALDKLEQKHEEDKQNMAMKRKINYTRLLLVVTAFVVLISVIGHFIFSGPKEVVEVPNVVNMSVVEAKNKLEALNLKVDLEEKFGDKDKFKPGTVMEQSVKAGEKRKEGSLIILFVSKGAEIKGVPDLKGMSLNKATATLEDVGFKVGKIERKYVKDVRIGTVVEQLPKATEKAPKGTEIALVLCEGNKEVPALIGKTQTEAKALLQSIGLAIGNVRVVTNPNVKKDVIITCNPDAGTKVGEGDKVDITVSDGGPNSSAYIDFAIPGNKMCKVEITVNDNNGQRVVYSGMKKGGIRIRQKVEAQGNAKATLKIDGQVVEEKSL